MREISPLQKERLNYQPKLAGALANGINAVKLALGEATSSVADEKDIQELFPNVYGKPIAKFASVGEDLSTETKNVGVISGPSFAIDLVSKMPAGNHTVDFAFKGDEKYHSWNESHNFTIIYQAIMPFTKYFDEDSIVSLALPESAKGNLELYVDGKLYKSVKVVDGDAVITLGDFIPGKYLLSAKYSGDDFEVDELNRTLRVYPNIVCPGEMYVGENGVVTVKTSKSANATVIFSVAGKNVTVKAVNGIAKLLLKDFKVGETDIDAFYIGQASYTTIKRKNTNHHHW